MNITNFSRAIFAIAMMLIVAFPTLAHDFEVDGIFYKIRSETAKTVNVSCKGYDYDDYYAEYTGSVTIPSTVTYNGISFSVTGIDNNTFYECGGLTSITIPNSVTSIGNSAFSYCKNLSCIVIGNSVTSIGNYAFLNCSNLTSITIPNSVTSIGDMAFRSCTTLNKVTINDGNKVLKLGYGATSSSMSNSKGLFEDCPVDTLYLGRNLSYDATSNYGYSPFYNLKTLTKVYIGNNVTTLGANLFRNCSNLLPFIIPSSVTTIEKNVFVSCKNLTTISIPNSVTSIGECAFHGCSNLKELILEDGTEELLFDYDYSNVDITSNYSPISLLNYCPLETLHLGRNVKYNSEYKSFNPKNTLKNLIIGNLVKHIGDYAFSNCTEILGTLSFPHSIISIGKSAFSDCNGLTTINLPDSLMTIEESAFAKCTGISSIIMPNTLTAIDAKAFSECTTLKSVSFGKSIATIGTAAFGSCNNLLNVTSLNPMPQNIDANAFSSAAYTNATLTVPYKCNGLYAGRTGWGSFNNIVEMEMPKIYLTLKFPESGTITHKEVYEEAVDLSFKANEGWEINSVTFNEEDVTAELDNEGNYTTPILTADAIIVVVFEKIETSVEPISEKNEIKVYAYNGEVRIVGAEPQSKVSIYNSIGALVYKGNDKTIVLNGNGVYILTVEGRTFKFAM